MSIIAFKIFENKIQVAFDGRCMENDKIDCENYIKAYKLSNVLIIGVTGFADTTLMFKNFVDVNIRVFEQMKSNVDAIPMMIRFKEALIEHYGFTEENLKELGGFMIINKHYHAVFYFDEKTLRPYPIYDTADWGAFGSTRTYTSALIDVGYSLEEAIKISAKKYTSINDNVTILEIER